ncbi:hypothetical protein AZ66_23450 [Paenibacillus sp. E194]|uniref:Uncharacterized protein n=1 Tax=Paenibacillus alvei TS-15 TaxID=1117108 RepID=S9SVR0_PAEAL|nr:MULTISPECIES: hypothetical protein [Paenibacillus]EPY08223.1 hypothetical protein PAALTS15_05838 [Paenibacillus alvei TS-15]KJB85635.1 hypothetical protein AZ66_23450 [Paenibacillus sp. E194]SDF57241.1 hypothetical protein SAMN04488689_105394 [Paenibacillus sp. cl6col]
MYILALIIFIITGLVSVLDILFGISNLGGEGFNLAIRISRLLFVSSALFLLVRKDKSSKKKD